MKPGKSVASPRSITLAPAGTARPDPAARIFPPSTITTPSRAAVSPLPSKIRAALRTTTSAAGGVSAEAAAAVRASTATMRSVIFTSGAGARGRTRGGILHRPRANPRLLEPGRPAALRGQGAPHLRLRVAVADPGPLSGAARLRRARHRRRLHRHP